MGRPRLKGERLPNLSVVAEDPSTIWAPATVDNWYGSGERTVEVASATAVWYSTGLPAVPIRWVLVRNPQGAFATQALLCAPILSPDLSRSLGGLSCVGRWRRPSRKRGDTWAWRRSGSGRSWRSEEPHRRCWGCSRSSPCSLTSEWCGGTWRPSDEWHGTASLAQPSQTLWRWYARSCGHTQLFAGRRGSRTR
jgi:hypothetical protein